MTVRILRPHENVKVLRLEVSGVAQLNVHVVILHRILNGHLIVQRLVHRPFLIGQLLHLSIIGLGIAAGEQQHRKKTDYQIYPFHIG